MDPAHAAQYNWRLIVLVCLKYRLDIAGDILEGPFFHIYHDEQHEGIINGYFRYKRKWHLVKNGGRRHRWSHTSRAVGPISNKKLVRNI